MSTGVRKKTVCGFSVLRRAFLILFLLMSMLVVSAFFMRLGLNDQGDTVVGPGQIGQISIESVDAHTMADTIRYIPRRVVETWARRKYLVVFGIPSVDLEERRRRRYLQRSTCWRFPGVATKTNKFTGEMLVVYILARHPSHGYSYSAALQEEAREWHDVLTLPINEGRPSTDKVVGGDGFWGMEAEVGMSRKTFMWFYNAYQLFPNVSFMGKGDDDMFLRVPQYLADLRTLPRRGLYWGLLHTVRVSEDSRKMMGMYTYAAGFCMTLARDVVEQFVSYEPLQRLVLHPQKDTKVSDFYSVGMDHEDMMVGRALYERNYLNIVFAREKPCHFHDIHVGPRIHPVTSRSVVIHHLLESDYAELMKFFENDTSPAPRSNRRGSKRFIRFSCNQLYSPAHHYGFPRR